MFEKPYAYISGALTDLSETRRDALRTFYEQIAEVCEQHGLKGYLPHKVSDPVAAAHLSPEDVDRLDRVAVCNSALVIAYVGEPSTGVGIEVEIAHHANIPCWLVYEKDRFDARRISRLVRGNPACREQPQISFVDTADALQALAWHLERQVPLLHKDRASGIVSAR